MTNYGAGIDSTAETGFSAENSPFSLANESTYQDWKRSKLENRNGNNSGPVVKIDRTDELPPDTLDVIAQQIMAYNFICFELDTDRRDRFSSGNFLELGRRLGLHRAESRNGADFVTRLSALDREDPRSRYIPFSNRALNWHTDGYYNPLDSSINAFSLYCLQQASEGGDNFLLDHEMLYLQIRDQHPDLLFALMDPGIMLVPPNMRDNRTIREAESGPVFRINPETGGLAMRYSSRPQNIEWKTDARSRSALKLLRELIIDSEYCVHRRLQSGQGIICNNLLHGRKAFSDPSGCETPRLYYRARYYDAVNSMAVA